MPGKHNVQNCLASIAVARDLGLSFKKIAKALESFKGIERRFCFKGIYKGAEIFDDYGHHPKEIQNVLAVAKKRAKKKLIVAFQPHRYTRTHKLWDQFIETFLISFSGIFSVAAAVIADSKPKSAILPKLTSSD